MEWISVEDEKPPIDRSFLCCVWDDTYFDRTICYAYKDDENHYEGNYYENDKIFLIRIGFTHPYRYRITYWMPLPEVPHEMD